jgi:hypothetical protein
MPKVVIEEFVQNDDDKSDEEDQNQDQPEKVGKPTQLLTHHEIDDFANLDK